MSTAQLAAMSYLALGRGMAREVAEHGLTVNAVAPGVVDTDIRVVRAIGRLGPHRYSVTGAPKRPWSGSTQD